MLALKTGHDEYATPNVSKKPAIVPSSTFLP